MLKLEFLSSFGSWVACELARASSLMKRAKIVARLVKKLIEQSRVDTSYERVEPAHEFLVHSPALVSVVRRLPQATARGRGRMTARGEAHWRRFQAASFPHADRRRSSGWRPWRAAIGSMYVASVCFGCSRGLRNVASISCWCCRVYIGVAMLQVF
jgi:hypothetical protein